MVSPSYKLTNCEFGKFYTPSFVEGANAKRVWAKKSFEKFGGIAKMAYVNASPVGLIQYQPKPEEHLLEITCIFVPNKQNHGKGIGKALLNALVKDAENLSPSLTTSLL